MNRTVFLAGNAMRKSGNTTNRPEQLLITEIIEYHAKNHVNVETEKQVTYRMDDGSFRDAYPDITVLEVQPNLSHRQYAIRVMGEYHDSKRQTRKDDMQKDYLLNIFDDVIDMWYYNMPFTFKRRDRLLKPEELVNAHAEVLTHLYGKISLVEPLQFWMRDSQHLKRQ